MFSSVASDAQLLIYLKSKERNYFLFGLDVGSVIVCLWIRPARKREAYQSAARCAASNFMESAVVRVGSADTVQLWHSSLECR